MQRHTIIVGGGLAGLAAATALAQRNVRVTLFESRNRLGGRASSFVDRETNTYVDNCQHVSMGCCTNFQHFCETLGISDFFHTEDELYFIGPDGTTNRVKESFLPAPLHLFPSFRKLSYLTAAEGRRLAKGLRALARFDPVRQQPQPFDQWLDAHQQPPRVIERFWQVVMVSALSESLDRIDVAIARKVFIDAFLANRQGWRVQIPIVPLEELYGARMKVWFESRGTQLRLGSGVTRLIMDDDIISAVELRSGEIDAADHFILALPHHLALPLLPELIKNDARLAQTDRLESAPISSVHLWFDRPITDLRHAVLIGRLSQWMFNRTVLQPSQLQPSHSPAGTGRRSENKGVKGHYYQIVISASRELAGRPQQEVIDEIVDELTELWPAAADAQLVHSRLVTEHRAVFSPRVGAEQLRPEQQTPIANLQLAGDWTKTGWPATMESAVRSGYRAAENVLGRLGRPETIVQPDLPVALLSKLLFGL